ncbi:hypothetical protein C4D60_Mb05t03510 [Musa balbisiana]|uniref:RING-type E3 ubiquitin transferase n=1 Tax=Musa balbisiana TaxID=52838 RepID=A0A4S8JTE6_MUSBA|nr:hypothetical protein C4D60_Mb05t03510 [Musa balbisiana]
MGNTGSRAGGGGAGLFGGRRRNSGRHHHHHHDPPPFGPAPSSPAPQPQQPPPPEVTANRYVFAAATPYPPQYPNPNPPQYFQYGYYPPPPPAMPAPLPAPFDHHHRGGGGGGGAHGEYPAHHPGWVGTGRYLPCVPPPPPPHYVEHQKAVTIRNDVNIKKETLRKFRQPSGTGIDFSVFDGAQWIKEGGELGIYPLAVKADAFPSSNQGPVDENSNLGTSNSQITQAFFEKKENGEYHVRVVKQILWVNQTRYKLQEIYGIGNSVDNDTDGNDPGKECVICLSEPRDTTVLPCRHMCMCSECAKVLRFQTNRCPICRQPVERLLEIKVNDRSEQQQETQG